jgi:hypothetical protein
MFLVISYRNALTEVFGWMWLARVGWAHSRSQNTATQISEKKGNQRAGDRGKMIGDLARRSEQSDVTTRPSAPTHFQRPDLCG